VGLLWRRVRRCVTDPGVVVQPGGWTRVTD